MIEAALPANEPARLAALKDLDILDTPIEERFERITRMLSRTLGVPVAAFNLIDELRYWLKSAQGLNEFEAPRRSSFCAHTILEKDDVMLVPDAREDLRLSDHPLVVGPSNVGFYAGCSVRAPSGEKVGTLCALDTKPRKLSGEEIQTLRDLAAMVETELRAIALAQSQKDLTVELDTTKRLAMIDPLTRLWNRGGMSDLLNKEWAVAMRRKLPLAVAIADMDHFKLVNDTYGHPVGDEVLQIGGRRLLSGLRTGDAIGRWGGEEFLIALPGATEDALPAILERIRSSLTKAPIQTSAGKLPVTASFGAAIITPTKDDTLAALIKSADDALYKAKHAGRDCAVIA